MKGIILAGGRGTRLFPLTIGVSKQLLPVYDKPMIYYPLSMLMLALIRDILVITTPEDQAQYQRFLGGGSQWGLSFSYAVQNEPRGLADAFIVGEQFIDNDSAALILGDNIFYGNGLPTILQEAATLDSGAVIFAYPVNDPERYGVAVPGIYFYDNRVIDFARNLKPSARGEIEITDLNKIYMDLGELRVKALGRGVAWLDAGMHHSLLQASNFVQAVEERQGMMISCPEEIAFRMGFISKDELIQLSKTFSDNQYGRYLLKLANGELL